MRWERTFTCIVCAVSSGMYTIKPDASDGYCVEFSASEHMTGENCCRLDGHVVIITDVFQADDFNRPML